MAAKLPYLENIMVITMTMKYELPKNATALNVLIDAAISSARTMQTKVQLALVAILYHAYKHGDYTAANRLVNELSTGIKKTALVEFFEKYGGLIVDETDAKLGFTGWKGADYIKSNFDAAKECMWWTLKPEPAFKAGNNEEAMKRVIDTIKKNKAQKQALLANGDEDKASQVMLDISSDTMRALMALLPFEFETIATDEANDATASIAALTEQLEVG